MSCNVWPWLSSLAIVSATVAVAGAGLRATLAERRYRSAETGERPCRSWHIAALFALILASTSASLGGVVMAQRYGGKHSPRRAAMRAAPPAHPRRARAALALRVNLLFLAPCRCC